MKHREYIYPKCAFWASKQRAAGSAALSPSALKQALSKLFDFPAAHKTFPPPAPPLCSEEDMFFSLKSQGFTDPSEQVPCCFLSLPPIDFPDSLSVKYKVPRISSVEDHVSRLDHLHLVPGVWRHGCSIASSFWEKPFPGESSGTLCWIILLPCLCHRVPQPLPGLRGLTHHCTSAPRAVDSLPTAAFVSWLRFFLDINLILKYPDYYKM